MPVGKESIKRAATAGKKKTAPAENAAPEAAEVKTAEAAPVEKKTNGIIQCFEELPVWLL
ncbi:MAG: hypothetical protein J6D53_01060 [Blautia sp.]|nr:hypothetical protein [Blautia sp.]